MSAYGSNRKRLECDHGAHPGTPKVHAGVQNRPPGREGPDQGQSWKTQLRQELWAEGPVLATVVNLVGSRN